jgi:hypothetical protein
MAEKLSSGVLTRQEATDLEFFMMHGYMVIDLEIPPEVFEKIDSFVEDVWEDRPNNMHAQHPTVNGFAPYPMHLFPNATDKASLDAVDFGGTKLLETHAHSPALAQVLFSKKIFRYMELIYEDVPVATHCSSVC